MTVRQQVKSPCMQQKLLVICALQMVGSHHIQSLATWTDAYAWAKTIKNKQVQTRNLQEVLDLLLFTTLTLSDGDQDCT